jgi:hypothetical protein
MSDLLGDKNYIDKLINAITVEDAINSFTLIDEKIFNLIKCSADDFLSLNDHFKNYHKESKNIAQNAANIVQTITNTQINKSFTDLKAIAENFNSISNIFTNRVEILDVELKKAINKLESIKIKHHNFKQNALSIKVLLANTCDRGLSPSKQSNVNEISEEVEQIKNLLNTADSLADRFVEKATESYLFLSSIKKENYDHLLRLNDNVEISFSLFNKKYQEASNFFGSLKELTDKNSSNIASIITNLQYHDIIQQKIEHIQRTHKDILNELRSLQGREPGMALIHNKVKTFIKIRDVAGLQAAQLIHANNQYQVAINEISKNLEDIGNEMIAISSMCDNLVGKSGQAKDYYLNNILDNLNNALSYNQKLVQLLAVIKQQTELLDEIKKELKNTYNNIQIHKSNIHNKLKGILDVKDSNNKKCLDMINGLLSESDDLPSHLDVFYNELNSKFIQALNLSNSVQGEINLIQSFNKLSDTIPGLIELLKENTKKVDEFLFVNSTISLNVSDSILNSLKSIRYYELFEKSCDTIIEELNSINTKLNYGSEMTDKNREENLRLLKSRYTMASEHIIHEHISKLADISEFSVRDSEQIIDLANQNSTDDDDNLELF